jgi:hypothetical protein
MTDLNDTDFFGSNVPDLSSQSEIVEESNLGKNPEIDDRNVYPGGCRMTPMISSRSDKC